ncbi:MAG: TonB-dependent receptor, partial [Sneathiella sp.]
TLDTFNSDLVHKLNLKMTDITSKTVNGSGAGSGTNGERYHASYQATYFLDTPTFAEANHRVTGGLEIERETFQNRYPSSAAQAKTQSRNLYGGILEYHGEFLDRFSVTAAIRQDRNDSFDNSLTYSLGSSYHIKETGSRFHASLGTGITNPTFYEQFGFNPGTFVGNSSLKPEESFGWDVGIEQKFLEDRLVVDITYFNETLTDEISTIFSGGSFTPINLDGKSDRQGIEVSVSYDILENLTGTASYTYLDATEPDGDQEVRRPRHSGALGLNYVFLAGKASLFGAMIFNGEMEDSEFITATPQSRETLDQYFLLNIGGRYQLTDKIELQGRIENLLNENYQEVLGFNSPGIGAFIGLRAEF